MPRMAACLGDVMDSAQRRHPFGKGTAGPIAPVQGLANRAVAGTQYEEPARGLEGRQDQLRSLEQWVCELLIKNQELRMALDSVKAQEKERQDG